MSELTEQQHALTEQLIASTVKECSLESALFSAPVHDALNDYRAAVNEPLSAGRQLQADAGELAAKKDLVAEAGYRRLKAEMLREAKGRLAGADLRAGQALERLKAAVDQDALPRVNPAREALARQELALGIGEAKGPEAASRALAISERGSREAVAALLSPFGQALLEARELTGRAHTEAIAACRQVAAVKASELGTTPTEILAGSVRASVGKLGAAKGSAGTYLLNCISEAEKS